MAFSYLTNLPLDEARRDYLAWLEEAGFSPRTQRIPVTQAAGRITARAIYAADCSPHYPACAMDGIAVAARDTFGASETTPVALTPDRYEAVDTGDPLPPWADAVVMVEEVLRQGDRAVLHQAAAPWQHVRQIGEDVCAGDMLLPGRTAITPAALGAMLAGGVTQVEVLARPVVGILPTGDEVVPADAPRKPGDVPEFNSAIFSAMLEQWGAQPRVFPIAKDNPEALCAALTQAAEACDIVLLNAGSSAGREDYSAAAVTAVGEVFCHGLAIRPGKPAILGRRGKVPILGVPGYPVSGILVVRALVPSLLERWTGLPAPEPERAEAVLTRRVVSGLKYREFVRVSLGRVGQRLVAAPLARGAGVVSSLLKADGILDIPQGVEGLEAGDKVSVELLVPRARLENTLVIIGSHDPLLDELANLMHQTHPTLRLSSTHVGSLGGIMALRRGEAHGAGCHLLNEADGTYNTAWLEKYFPQGGRVPAGVRGPHPGADGGPRQPPGAVRLSGHRPSRSAVCQPAEGLGHPHSGRLPL